MPRPDGPGHNVASGPCGTSSTSTASRRTGSPTPSSAPPAEDRRLLRRFVRWATGESAPSQRGLQIVEQRLPGEPETDEQEYERLGLPDAWIFDNNGWCLLIESKISSTLTADQLRRHRRTAERRGFTDIMLLALDVAKPRGRPPANASVRTWTEICEWLMRQSRESDWALRAARYLEVAERRFVEQEYLKEGTLTTFTGIPFSRENPYNYPEGKRLLKLAMDDLRQRKALVREAQEMKPVVLSELRLLSSCELDSRSILTVILAGDGRLVENLQSPELLPIASRVRSRLRTESLGAEELREGLRHLLKAAGNPRLLSAGLLRTLCEHAVGNYRVLMNMANDLLTEALRRELDVIDEKLFFEVFALDSTAAKNRTKT